MGYKTAILKFRTAAMFEGSQTGSVLPRTRIDMTGSEAQVSTGLWTRSQALSPTDI